MVNQQMMESIKLYNDMAKGWVLKAAKKCLISIFQDPTQSLDFHSKPADSEAAITEHERDTRLMRLRVRCKGFLDALTESLTIPSNSPPLPLIQFLGGLVKPGAFLPDNFLFSYELQKITLNQYGAIPK